MLELTDDVRQGLAKTAGHGALSFNTEEYAKAMDLKNAADDSFNVRGLPGGTFGQSLIDSTLGVAGNIDDFFGGPTGLGDYANNYVTAQEMAMGEKPKADFSWDYFVNGLPRDTGNLIGSGISLAAPVAAATLAAPFVGVGATAAGIGGAIAGAGLESMAEGGDKLRSALENGDSLETAQDKARTVAGENMALLAPTNILGLGALKKVGQGIKNAYKGGKLAAADSALANYPMLSQATDFAKGAGWAGLGAMNEGAQEAWQQGIQDSVEPNTDWGVLPWNWNDEQAEAFKSTIGPTMLMAGAGGGARLAARKLGTSDVSQSDLGIQANNNLFGAGTAEIATQGADIDEQVAHLKDGYQSVIPQIAGVLVNDFGIEGAQISSGFRTREHNREVGGSENSYHVGDGEHGDALDIVLPDGTSPETAEAIKQRFENSGVFDEVLFHDAGSGYHLHLGGLKTDNIGNSYGSYSGDTDVDSAINEMAEKYNLDPALLAAIAEQESGFNQSAQSEAGAMGIMQLMPGTAEGLGVDPSDLRGNLEGGAKYLRQMLDKYDGDVEKALAAYNAGPGSLDNVNGDISQLSGETQKYVPAVMERYNKFKNKSGGGISNSGKILDWDSTNEDFSKLGFFPKDGEQSQGTANEFLENLAKLEESDDKDTKEKGRKAQDVLQQYGDDTEKLTEKARELGYQQIVDPTEVHGRIPMRRIVPTALDNGQVTFATQKAADIFASSPIGQTMERQGKTFKVTDKFKMNEQVNAISQQVNTQNQSATKTVQNTVRPDVAVPAPAPLKPEKGTRNDGFAVNLLNSLMAIPEAMTSKTGTRINPKAVENYIQNNDLPAMNKIISAMYKNMQENGATNKMQSVAREQATDVLETLLNTPEALTSTNGARIAPGKVREYMQSGNVALMTQAINAMSQNLRDKGIDLESQNQNTEKSTTLPAVQGERLPSADVRREEPAIEGTVEDTVITPPYNGKPAYNDKQLEAPAIESDHLNSEDFLAGLSPVERGFMKYLDKVFHNLQLGFNDVLEYLRARQKDIFNKRMESVIQQGPQGLTGAFYTDDGKMVVDDNMPQEVQNAWNQLLSMRKNFGASLANSTAEIQNEYLRVESAVKDYLTTTVTEQCKNNESWRKLNYAITGLEAIANKARRYEQSVSEEGKRGSTKSYRDVSAEEGQALEDSTAAWSGVIHQYDTTETRLRSFLNTLGSNFTKNNHGMALRAKTKYKGQSMTKAGRIEALIRDGGRVEERGKEYFAVAPNGNEIKVNKGEHNYYKWLMQNDFAQQERAPEGAPQLAENNGVTEDNYRARQPEYHGEENLKKTVSESSDNTKPLSIEENIAKGTKALNTVINTHQDVRNAMNVDGIGIIDLVWGTPGKGLKFKGGFGIAHILAKRGDDYQKGRSTVNAKKTAHKLIEVIAKGEKRQVQHSANNNGEARMKIEHDGYTAVLSLAHGKKNTWLLTGWENDHTKKEVPANASSEGYDSATATADTPTLTRRTGETNTSFTSTIPQNQNKGNEKNNASNESMHKDIASAKDKIANGGQANIFEAETIKRSRINTHSAEALKENGNSNTELDRLPKVPIVKLRQSEQRIVKFGKAIGVPVHFVESNDKTNRGVFTHNGEIFINRKAKVSAHSIFVHEFVHWLKASPENAGAYDVLHACLENSSGLFNEARINKYRDRIFDGEKMADEEIVEEIICDAMTHTESAEKLMRAVNNVDGNLATRIAGCLKAMWDKFCEYMNFKQHKMSNEQHLPNELSVAEFQRADTAFNKILLNLKNDKGEPVFHRVGTELLLHETNAKPVETYPINPISYTYAGAYSKENGAVSPMDEISKLSDTDNVKVFKNREDFENTKPKKMKSFWNDNDFSESKREAIFRDVNYDVKDLANKMKLGRTQADIDKIREKSPVIKELNARFNAASSIYKEFYAVQLQYAREVFEHGEQTILNREHIQGGSKTNLSSFTGNTGQKRTERTSDQDVYQTTNGRRTDISTELQQKNGRLDHSITELVVPGEYDESRQLYRKMFEKRFGAKSSRDAFLMPENGKPYTGEILETVNLAGIKNTGNKYSRGVDLSPSTDGVAIAARANNNLVAHMKGLAKKANAKFNPFHHEELENLRIDKHNGEKDLNLIEYQFVSPTRESKKYKAIQPFVMKGKQAMAKQERLRFEFTEGMNEVDKLLGWREGFHRNDSKFKERKKALNEILLKGDLEGKEFTNAELIKAGYDAETIKGYHKMRALLDKAWKLANDTKSRIKYESITSSTQRRAEADFADLKDKNPFAEIISKVHNPDGTVTINYKAPHVRRVAKQTVLPSELENLRKNKDVHIVETTQSLKGTTQVTYYQREAGMGKLKGYIPHIFHGWYVCKVDKDGKAIMGEDGDVSMDNIVTTANSLSEAAKLGRELAKANPNDNYRVIPQMFSAPGAHEQAIVMGDFDYARIVGQVADSMSMSVTDAQAMLDNTVKLKNRGRFYGYAMKRKGFKGFEQNVYLATMKYFNQTARYAAMDSFKRDSISMYNRIFGAFDDETVTKRSAMAKWTKQYISDMNGTPTWIEKMFNNILHNFGFGEERAGGRPVLWAQQKIFTYPMTIVKLGVFNPSSALLNLTQLFNLYGAMGEKVLSPKAYQRLLHKGFADTFRAMSNKDSELGRLLWKDLGLDYQIGMDIASGYSNAEVSNLASLRGFAGRLAGKSMYLFRQTDAFARGVTLLTAYNKALDEGKSKAEAIEYAKEINDKVNFDYSVADEPTIFRALGPISKVFLQFRKYPVKQLELFQDFYLDGRELGLNRKQSLMRMIKYMAPYMAMSGMMGIPFASLAGGLFSYFMGIATGDDDWDLEKKAKQFMITEFGEDCPLTQWWLYGAGSFIGLNLGSRVGVGDFLGSDSYNSADGLAGLAWNQTTLGSTVNQVYRQMSYRNYAEALKAVNPTIGNIVQAYKGEVRTTRGRMKYQYQNMAERMWRAIGFTPLNETLAGDLASNEYAEKQEQTKAKQEAIDDFLADPSSENAARLNELGVTPKSLENESARRTMNRHQLNELAKEKEEAKKKKKPKTYSTGDYLKAVQ